MYHDQNSQSSSSGEETIIVENNIYGNGALHAKIAHENSVQQQPLQSLPPQRQQRQQQQQQSHNGTNGRQLHRHVDKLQKNQPTNFAQWLTDIDSRVHLCLGSINPFPCLSYSIINPPISHLQEALMCCTRIQF